MRECLKRNQWTPRQLETAAGIPEGVVEKVLGRSLIEQSFASKLVAYLATCRGLDEFPPAAPAADRTASFEDMRKIMVVVPEWHVVVIPEWHDGEGVPIELDDPEVQRVVARTVRHIQWQGSIEKVVIFEVRRGSIEIILGMERQDAVRVKAAFENGHLDYLDIYDVRILPPPRSVWDFLGLALGCVGGLCCLAGLYQPVRVPACIACIVFGVIGILYPIGRKLYVRRKK